MSTNQAIKHYCIDFVTSFPIQFAVCSSKYMTIYKYHYDLLSGIAKQVYRTGVGKFIHDVDQFDTKPITNKHGKDIDSSLQMNEDVLRKKQKLLLKSQLTDFSSW